MAVFRSVTYIPRTRKQGTRLDFTRSLRMASVAASPGSPLPELLPGRSCCDAEKMLFP